MKIIKTQATDIAQTPHKVAVRKLFSFDHATFVHITLESGETLLPHITPVDATFYILEGKGKVEIGDEIEQVSKGDLVFSPANIKHRLKNSREESFSFLVIKTPTPKNQKTIIL